MTQKYVTVTVVKTIVDSFTMPVNGHFDETDATECADYAEFHGLDNYSEPETIGAAEFTVSAVFEK